MTLCGPRRRPARQGKGSLTRRCQSTSSTRHMKGIHSSFYGPKWLQPALLASEFMYPIARINNARLIRDPGRRDPWREGCWEKERERRARRRLCAPLQIIVLKNVFIGKNLFQEFIKDVPLYIFRRESLCYRGAAVFKDAEVTAPWTRRSRASFILYFVFSLFACLHHLRDDWSLSIQIKKTLKTLVAFLKTSVSISLFS